MESDIDWLPQQSNNVLDASISKKEENLSYKTIWVFLLLEKIKIKNLGFDNLTYESPECQRVVGLVSGSVRDC